MMRRQPLFRQDGVMLIEALIAILIFSLGVLGIVGLQATMTSSVAESKYRTEASFFANRLLGEMAASDRSSATAMATYQSPAGLRYKDWYNDIQNASAANGLLGLPGAAANPPTVSIQQATNITGQPTRHDVTVTVFWQSPGQPLHQHVVTTSISAD
jgi:type IV pilus assembly protein PilV